MAQDDTGEPDEGAIAAETDSRPDGLPERFRSVEDMAQSYSEAERRLSEQGRELNELRTQFTEFTESVTAQQQQVQQQYDPNEHPLVLAAQQAMDNGDAQALTAIYAQIADAVATEKFNTLQAQQPAQEDDDTIALLEHTAVQRLVTSYPDLVDEGVQQQVAAQLRANPGLIGAKTLAGVQNGIENAYKLAKADTLMEQQNSANATAAAAEAERQAKLAQTGLTGSGARQAPPDEAQAHMARLIGMKSGTFRELLDEARS